MRQRAGVRRDTRYVHEACNPVVDIVTARGATASRQPLPAKVTVAAPRHARSLYEPALLVTVVALQFAWIGVLVYAVLRFLG